MTSANASARFTILREVFGLAREQRHALESESLERFQELLDRRQGLIDELLALTAGDEQALPANVIPFPGALPTDDEDLLALDTLIRGILEHDRQNEAVLAAMLQDIRAELPALEHGRAAAARYASEPPRPGFIDRVS